MPQKLKEKSPCLSDGQTKVFPSVYNPFAYAQGTGAPCNNDYIDGFDFCQGDSDVELLKKFRSKKSFNEVLAEAYRRNGDFKKFVRVKDCGTFLEFRQYETDVNSGVYGDMHLHNANFCRDRLCPLCSWRRTLKIFSQVSRLVDVLQNDYKFIFLTLTVPNCTAEELPQTIDRLLKSFKKLMRLKKVNKCIYGYFRALEVTVSKGDFNILTRGTYHPHLHIILAVKPSYFNRNNITYISHSEWLDMWRRSYGDNNIQNVNVKTCKPKKETAADKTLSSAVAEIAKYCVKDSDYLIGDFLDIENRVKTLNLALKGRRLTQYGGCFYNLFKSLNLNDVESSDIDLTDEVDIINPELNYIVSRYKWSTGYYNLFSVERHINSVYEVLNE